MKPWIRWALGSVAALLAVATTAVVAGQAVAERRMHRKVDVQVPSVSLPGDASALDRGRYLYASRGCADCHGSDGAGRRFIDDAALRVRAPHISPGPGSVTAAYRTDDWVRTIRHGVKPNGSPVMIMPSEDYNRMTDADLGALVAYMRQMPAVDGGGADLQLGLPVRLLYAAGVVQDAAAKIDHTLPPQQPVAEGPTPEHGRYVANMCLGCHGESLSGGPIAGAPPDWPAAANLTSGAGGVMSRYASADAFAAMLKSGRRPDGSAIAVMPFGSLAALNDVDVRALHAYLQTLEPRATGTK
jgi:mono/diheme cytochrome c family protein